jgi:hypothetical protein
LYLKAEDTYNQMLALYSGFGLTFLKEGLLHRPSRKHRKCFKQGTNRKRDEINEVQNTIKKPEMDEGPEGNDPEKTD